MVGSVSVFLACIWMQIDSRLLLHVGGNFRAHWRLLEDGLDTEV
jgi:hypothetical protein